jgi:hypothetical protein
VVVGLDLLGVARTERADDVRIGVAVSHDATDLLEVMFSNWAGRLSTDEHAATTKANTARPIWAREAIDNPGDAGVCFITKDVLAETSSAGANW